MKSLWRVLRVARWSVPVLSFSFLVFVWIRAGMDVRYMMRVLVHRDSSTSDYLWKHSMPVRPAMPWIPWLEAPECSAVTWSARAGGGS